MIWTLSRQQEGVVSRRQLLAAGYSPDAVKHRVRTGRLHRRARGVFAVGRPDISRGGEMWVAVLTIGGDASISHETACERFGIRRREPGLIEASVTSASPRCHRGMRIHSRRALEQPAARGTSSGLPVTSLPLTLIDVACRLTPRHLEAAVNQADALDLLDPEALRRALDEWSGQPGVRVLRSLLDAHTFRLTDSELERMFLALVRAVGLPEPQTRRYANSWRVDFLWPELGLVVETDSLRYHRTPSQQARDYRRDQAHQLAGLTPLRFTHFQIAHERALVIELMEGTVERLTENRLLVLGAGAPQTRKPR